MKLYLFVTLGYIQSYC